VLDNNEIEKIINVNGPVDEGSDKEKVRELHT
jgi:hypothetical protein